MWCSDMVCISRSAATGNFTINFCSTGKCMFKAFQYQRTCTFAQYKTIAFYIEWA